MDLMQVKGGRSRLPILPLSTRGVFMPTETAIVVVGIVVMFSVFAAVLVWASAFTRDVRVPGATYFEKAKK